MSREDGSYYEDITAADVIGDVRSLHEGEINDYLAVCSDGRVAAGIIKETGSTNKTLDLRVKAGILARNRIIMGTIPFLLYIRSTVCDLGQVDGIALADDLFQEEVLTVFDAIESYIPEQGSKFTTYLGTALTHRMIDYTFAQRCDLYVPQGLHYKMYELKALYDQDPKRAITEIASEVGVAVDLAYNLLGAAVPATRIEQLEDGGFKILNIPAPEPQMSEADRIAIERTQEQILHRLFTEAGLTTGQHEVMSLLYGLTDEGELSAIDIAASMGRSTGTIGNHRKRARQRIEAYLSSK